MQISHRLSCHSLKWRVLNDSANTRVVDGQSTFDIVEQLPQRPDNEAGIATAQVKETNLQPKEERTEQIPHVPNPRRGSPLLQQSYPNQSNDTGGPCEGLHTAPTYTC